MNEAPERTARYRIRGEGDVLLYIGITCSLPVRWNSHQRIQPWWDELRSLTVDWYDSREDAEAAEKAAILAELPKYNKTYLMPRRRKPAQPALEIVPAPGPDFYRLGILADDEMVTTAELAEFLDITQRELGDLSEREDGPACYLIDGRWMYRPSDVREWLRTCRREVSSDARGAA